MFTYHKIPFVIVDDVPLIAPWWFHGPDALDALGVLLGYHRRFGGPWGYFRLPLYTATITLKDPLP